MAEIPPSSLARRELGAARLMLVAMYQLTRRGEERQLVWARTSTLAAAIGADERTAQRHLRTLVDAGEIADTGDGWVLTNGDNTVAVSDGSVGSPDNSVATIRQSCRGKTTGMSFTTLEEPILNHNTKGGRIVDPRPPADDTAESTSTDDPRDPPRLRVLPQEPEQVQLDGIAPAESKFDHVAATWAYQDELRRWAYEKRGRTGRKAPRKLRLDATARRAVRNVLGDYSVEDVRRTLRNVAREASTTDRALSYFDGVSNWRPRNFARLANSDADLLASRNSTVVQSPERGTLLAECADKIANEQCERGGESLQLAGESLVAELNE